jgi:hypothetical protein
LNLLENKAIGRPIKKCCLNNPKFCEQFENATMEMAEFLAATSAHHFIAVITIIGVIR